MILLWTKNNQPASWLIRWGLKEKSSHFAICFFEEFGDNAIVAEARFDGTQISWLGDFKSKHSIVHALQAPLLDYEESDLYNLISGQIRGKNYDKPAFFYWIWAGLAYRFGGKRLPKRNPIGRDEMILCIEVLGKLRDYLEKIGVFLDDIDLEMTSPEQAYILLEENKFLRDLSNDRLLH